jgi:hypothetical protein
MRVRSFKTPPFVVWRLESGEGHSGKQSRYRLVPHAVYGNILLHVLTQWIVLTLFVIIPHRVDIRSAVLLAFFFLALFLLAAVAANIAMLRLINGRSMQPVEALLALCPRDFRQTYDSVFPVVRDSERRWRWVPQRLEQWLARKRWFSRRSAQAMAQPPRWRELVRIKCSCFLTLHTTAYFLVWIFCRHEARTRSSRPLKSYWSLGLLGRPSQTKSREDSRLRLRTNLSRLRALILRREDSGLHAFSAFAVLSCFVPFHRRTTPTPHMQTDIPHIQTKFVAAYFAPIVFGFLLCIVTFCLFVARTSPIASWLGLVDTAPFFDDNQRFPFMVCTFVWFIQGILYSLSTLDRDFASLFRDYFGTRPFPKSMTRFANDIMANAPDLVALARERWLTAAITVVMLGLASLYADFLHSLE